MNSYFYVYKIGGGSPRYQHPSFEAAMTEAERLIDTVGGEYEILQARAVVKAKPQYLVTHLWETPAPPPTRFEQSDDSQIPF